MNRSDALRMWKSIAAGHMDHEEHTWVIEVAERILEADSDPEKLGPKHRVYAITRAVGLGQKIDKNAELRRMVEQLEGFFFLEEKNGEWVDRDFRHGEKMRGLIEMARSKKLVSEDVADHELRKRIERILNPRPKTTRKI